MCLLRGVVEDSLVPCLSGNSFLPPRKRSAGSPVACLFAVSSSEASLHEGVAVCSS